MHFFAQIRMFTQVTLLAASFFLLVPFEVQSADITLKWDIVEDARIEGYNIYCGKSGTNFKSQPVLSIDQRSQTTCTISGLEAGAVYGFAATSFDNEGRESRFSEELYHSISAEGPADSDGDGLTDDEEINFYGSNPDKADTDGDGISDGEEVQWWGENWQEDMDGDGTINLLDPDSDGDGASDGMDAIQNPEPTPGNECYRINVGGPKVTLNGVVWMKDAFFSGGRTYFKDLPISGTSQDPIYQSERFAKNIQYELPIENGSYTVKLHFAEIYWKNSDRRIFSVDIENGQAQLAGYDIYAKAGGLAAVVETFSSISVYDGVLNIHLSTKVDNAKLSAIEVTPSQDESETNTGNTTDDSVLYRINAGGPEVILNGKVWEKDGFYSDGNTYIKNASISGSTDDPIFHTERYGKNFDYQFPVEAGTYTVKLYLSEIYWKDTGKRVFHVNIEKSQGILDFYDIFHEVGGFAADLRIFENIAVTDGVLNLDFTTESDNAKVSAIEVIPY